MTILLKILLTFLSYAILTNLMFVVVKMDGKNPIAKFLSWSCGISWLISWLLGLAYVILWIWL